MSSATRLIYVLYRDAVIYFGAIFLIFVATCILFSNSDPGITGDMDGPTLTLMSILGNRVLFNLRAEDARLRSVGNRGSDGVQEVSVGNNHRHHPGSDDAVTGTGIIFAGVPTNRTFTSTIATVDEVLVKVEEVVERTRTHMGEVVEMVLLESGAESTIAHE